MLRKLILGSAVSVVALMSFVPETAQAQSSEGSVIMRRPLASKTRAFDWTVDQWSECSNSCGNGSRTRKAQCVLNGQYVYPDAHCTSEKPAEIQACTDFSGCDYKWEVKSDWTDVKGCGEVVETREMQCRRSDGTVVGREMCPTPVPDETRKVEDLNTCSYSWNEKPWSSYSSECAAAATRTRKVDCLRSNGQTVADSFCSAEGAKPAESETAERTSQCGYSWKAKDWGAFDSTCSNAAVHTREVVCLRSDGVEVGESLCGGAGEKPAVTETQPQYGSCSYSWKIGDFGAAAPACGESSATRTVECLRSNGDVVPDGQCGSAGPKPSTTEKRIDYSTCTYGFVEGSWGAWSSTCGQGTRTRDVSCMSSDGRKVSDSQCGGTKPATSESDYRTEGCTTSWQDGAWSRVPGCGASTDVRTPTCLRSDGQTVADAQCAPGAKPATSRPVTDYQTCTYGWSNGEWGGWSSSCGQAARYRDVWCQSSDGRRVEDGSCAAAGAKPEMQQSAYQTEGCARNWVAGAWGASDHACSAAAVQNRSVTCLRSDGQTVADGECTAAKPATSQTIADYSACTNYWVPLTGFTDWNSHCSATATRTRTVSCIRNEWNCDPNSPGIVGYHPGASTDCSRSIPDSSCAASPMPARTETAAVYDQCGYDRVNPSAWSGWDNACSGSAKRTRTYQCRRSDGTIVADGECVNRGISLTETETGANYTNACPGYFVTGAWSDYNSHCSTSATRTRDVTCYRAGDNVFAGDQYCTDRGVAVPPRSETGQVLDQCGYNWNAGGWGAPSAACGASARYRAVWCTRSDGVQVADSSCNPGTRPAGSEAATDYSACSYAWAYNGWGTTSQTCGSVSQSRSVWCRRADGATVADGYCGGGKPAATQTYADYSACSYAWTPGAFSTPSACGATTATRPVPCIRQDGAQVADAYCGGGQPATTTQTSDYSACGYNWKVGAFGAPTPACGASSQWRDVWCERTDGARVADGSCGGGRPSNTQGATDYQACDYNFVASDWSDWSSYCSASARRTRAVWCYRSDGTMMDPDHSSCYNAGRVYPGWEEYRAIYDRCGYEAVNWTGYGACNNGTKTRTAQCRRTDGTIVDASECTNRGVQVVDNQACQSACQSPTSGRFYIDRGSEGGQSFTTSTGSVRYTGTWQNNYNYSCGRNITGYLTVTSNGVTQTVSSTCAVPNGNPGSCSQQTTTTVGGTPFTVWTRISSFSSSSQSCTINVSINQGYPSC